MRRLTTWWWFLVIGGVIYGAWHWLAAPHQTWRVTERLVASLPYGNGLSAVGRRMGIDGREYGPLSFAVGNGELAIADTYHRRLLWRPEGRLRASWTVRALPDSLIGDVAWDGYRDAWVAADSRSVTIWLVRAAGVKPDIRIVSPEGMSLAWDQVMVASGMVYLAWTEVGTGRFVAGLTRYRSNGRSTLVAGWGQTLDGAWVPEIPPLIHQPALSYLVGNGGRIYLELPMADPHRVELAEFSADGQELARWSFYTPSVIMASRLVGAEGGEVFVAINTGIMGQSAKVYSTAFNRPPTLQLTLPPPRVLLHTYVRVGAHGTLYWAVSTAQAYQVWSQRRRLVTTGGLHF